MKTIYVDVLITVNIFIDFFLILCTKKLLHINAPYKRLLIAALLGGIESLIALLPELNFALNILFDLTGAAVIIFAAFGKCRIKTYIKRVAVYFVFSFTFCGIMIFVYSAFRPKGMEIYNDVVYFNISPVLLIILTLACYYMLSLIKRLTNGVKGARVCNVEIKTEAGDFSFCARIDTACTLKEPFSGKDVMVAEKQLLDNFEPREEKTRLIPFNSLGGSGIIKGFEPDEIKIDGKPLTKQLYIGLCENVINGEIKALVPAEIFE